MSFFFLGSVDVSSKLERARADISMDRMEAGACRAWMLLPEIWVARGAASVGSGRFFRISIDRWLIYLSKVLDS